MESNHFCQSCSMPLDKPELLGTEKDGTENHEYCIYCYQKGSFTNPGMSLEDMKVLVKEQMEKFKIEDGLIKKAIETLPHLKRWNKLSTAV